jgi:hypothetical protein
MSAAACTEAVPGALSRGYRHIELWAPAWD